MGNQMPCYLVSRAQAHITCTSRAHGIVNTGLLLFSRPEAAGNRESGQPVSVHHTHGRRDSNGQNQILFGCRAATGIPLKQELAETRHACAQSPTHSHPQSAGTSNV